MDGKHGDNGAYTKWGDLNACMRSIVLHSSRVKLQRLNTIYNIEDDEVVRYDDNGAGDEDWRMTGAESSGRKPV